MSRLLPEAILVALAPSHATIAGRRTPAGEAGPGSAQWQGAIAALKSAPLAHCRVSVELSSHFVRYALVPWSSAIATDAEEEAYVRHHFAKVHGERAKEWAVRSSEAAPGAPRLASAVDRALLDAIRAAVAGKPGAKLLSIRPQLMSRFNAWRRAVPAQGAWVVLAEPGRACIALHGRRGWRSVQNARGDWRALLERERFRVEGEVPDLVLLAGAPAPAGAGPWKFRAMAS